MYGAVEATAFVAATRVPAVHNATMVDAYTQRRSEHAVSIAVRKTSPREVNNTRAVEPVR